MLSDEKLMEGLGHLVAGTTGWTDDAVGEYADQLRDLGDGESFVAACSSIARGWSELRRPPIETILESYDREHQLRGRAIDPGRIHCDGSGWLPAGCDDFKPCPRCNVALAAIFDDPAKLALWRTGTVVEQLDVGVERVNGRVRYVDGYRPPTCRPADEISSNVEQARRVAWRSYEAHCREAGREPDPAYFDDQYEDVP
jgi:hypothetical protein